MNLRAKAKHIDELLTACREEHDDRDYFARRPGRRYRLRPPTAGERELRRYLRRLAATAEPELATSARPAATTYVIVHQPLPGLCVSRCHEGTVDLDREWDDAAIELLLSAISKSRIPAIGSLLSAISKSRIPS